jgi:hypothetical protein
MLQLIFSAFVDALDGCGVLALSFMAGSRHEAERGT